MKNKKFKLLISIVPILIMFFLRLNYSNKTNENVYNENLTTSDDKSEDLFSSQEREKSDGFEKEWWYEYYEDDRILLPKVSEIDFSKFTGTTDEFLTLERRFAKEYGYSTDVDFIWAIKDYNNAPGVTIPWEGFREGLALEVDFSKEEGEKGKYFFINVEGEKVFEIEHDISDYTEKGFSDGLFLIKVKDGPYVYLDHSGKEVLSLDYEICNPFYDGLARVYNRNQGYGFVDKKGREVIPLEYKYATDFAEGLAFVQKYDSDTCFVLNKNGEIETILNNFRFPLWDYFSCGLIELYDIEKEKAYYYDKNFNPVFDSPSGDKWGIYSKSISYFKDDVIVMRLYYPDFGYVDEYQYKLHEPPYIDGYDTYYDLKGNRILPLQEQNYLYSFSETLEGLARCDTTHLREGGFIKNPLTASIIYNGEELPFNNYLPVINNMVMAPYGELCEFFGLVTSIDKKTDSLNIKGDGISMNHKFIDKSIMVNGTKKLYENPSMVMLNDVYIPVAMITDQLALNTNWDKDTFTLTITDID